MKELVDEYRYWWRKAVGKRLASETYYIFPPTMNTGQLTTRHRDCPPTRKRLSSAKSVRSAIGYGGRFAQPEV